MATRRRRDLTQPSRPVSAIYIGKDPLQHNQDPQPSSSDPIPESPPLSATRVQRQLPSPPVTLDNRSTGDSASSQAGTIGRKSNTPLSFTAGTNELSMPDHDDNDHDLNEDDEDNTAKLSGDLRFSKSTPQIHPGGALARVKNLAERNRELTRRLSSLSRRDTPSPSGLVSSSTSSINNPTLPVNSHHTSRLSRNSFSGSETEREPAISSTRLQSIPPRRSFDSDHDPSPTLRTPSPPATFSRQRLVSAPASPGQAHTTPANLSSSIKPTAARRRRVSIELGGQEAASATLSRSAARLSRPGTSAGESSATKEEASATTIGRNSPISSGIRRQRQPLPDEFRDSSRSSDLALSDLQSSTNTMSSGRSKRISSNSRSSNAPFTTGETNADTVVPRTPKSFRPVSRSATLREPRKLPYHQRVESEQASSRISNDIAHAGRRQSLRGGSADSIIAQRSVIGEGLRAAGLARDGSDDIFSQSLGWQGSRRRLSGEQGSNIDEFQDRKERRSSAQPLGRVDTSTFSQRFTSRPSTSMGLFQSDDRSPRTGQSLLKQRSVYLPEREQPSPMVPGGRKTEYSGSTRNVYTPPTPSHRRTGRNSSLLNLDKGSLSIPASEHAKLMLDSLNMFESHLARMPVNSNASLSATTIPDLYHNVQSVVQAANTLNILLREANTHALDEQIEAEIREVNDDVDVSEIWRSIGSEYRETLRVSDELVRTMTGFLLGMGKILREATTKLDTRVDEEGRVNSPIGSQSSAGRRSSDGRRSLDFPVETSPRERERFRDESLRRIATQSSNRATSALGAFRQHQLVSDDERGGESTERPQRSAISGVRKIFSVKNGRLKTSSLTAASKPLLEEYTSDRNPASIPPPLETLPSESLLQRSPSGKTTRQRQGTVTTGTVKTSFPSFFSSSQPTTAITTTVVTNSQEGTELPLQRTISSRGSVAFTRSNASAANGLQKRFDTDTRMRSSSTTSTLDSERMAAVIQPGEHTEERVFRGSNDAPTATAATTVQKRTYTERKDRRRTVTEVFSRVN